VWAQLPPLLCPIDDHGPPSVFDTMPVRKNISFIFLFSSLITCYAFEFVYEVIEYILKSNELIWLRRNINLCIGATFNIDLKNREAAKKKS
jgi:hypothetical protein